MLLLLHGQANNLSSHSELPPNGRIAYLLLRPPAAPFSKCSLPKLFCRASGPSRPSQRLPSIPPWNVFSGCSLSHGTWEIRIISDRVQNVSHKHIHPLHHLVATRCLRKRKTQHSNSLAAYFYFFFWIKSSKSHLCVCLASPPHTMQQCPKIALKLFKMGWMGSAGMGKACSSSTWRRSAASMQHAPQNGAKRKEKTNRGKKLHQDKS